MNEETDGGWGSVVGGLFLAVVLGVLLGVAKMALEPTLLVDELPEEEKRREGVKYIIEGNDSSAGSYATKERALLSGAAGQFEFSEAELNTWFRRRFDFEEEKKAAKKERDGEGDANQSGEFALVKPSSPMFRFVDDKIQITMQLTLVNPFGGTKIVVFNTIGSFAMTPGGSFRFEPLETTLGQALFPMPVDRLVMSGLAGIFTKTPYGLELASVWQSLTGIFVDGNRLVISNET